MLARGVVPLVDGRPRPFDAANGAPSVHSNLSLVSPVDCLALAEAAYSDEDYEHAHQWLLEAVTRLEQQQGAKGLADSEANPNLMPRILEGLAYSTLKLGLFTEAHEHIKNLLQLDPEHSWAMTKLAHFESMMRDKEGEPFKSSLVNFNQTKMGYISVNESLAAQRK